MILVIQLLFAAINGIKGNDQYSGIITKNDIDKFTSMAKDLKMKTPQEALRTLKI